MVFEHVTHVIFDFDGLLVDTEKAYTIANTKVLKNYGKEYTMDLKRVQMGKRHEDAIDWLINEIGIGHLITEQEYLKKLDDVTDELFEKTAALPGAEKLVRYLINKDVPVALCTGSCSRTYPPKAKNHADWLDLINLQVLSGDDPEITRGKPDPQPFLVTMKRFKIQPASPKNVLVFEDSYNGVLSALAAGMQCVMVPDRSVFDPETDLDFKSQVTQVLDSLEDFEPQLFKL